jgi:uncharacterized protein YjlB
MTDAFPRSVKSNTHGRILRGGAYSMMGSQADPAIRLKKGDTITIKASHGIGHLMNSIYYRRVPPAKLGQYVAAQEARLDAESEGTA